MGDGGPIFKKSSNQMFLKVLLWFNIELSVTLGIGDNVKSQSWSLNLTIISKYPQRLKLNSEILNTILSVQYSASIVQCFVAIYNV